MSLPAIRTFFLAWLGYWLVLWLGPAARGYTPDSPEVQQMVGRGVEFLLKGGIDHRPGGKCIVALALLKAGVDPNEPVVQDAVAAAKKLANTPPQDQWDNVVYSLGLGAIFLCELDPQTYRPDIEKLIRHLERHQRSFGGWGYITGPMLRTSDTSMTQYAVLGCWLADRTGAYRVEPETITRVLGWLMRTQDPSGAWGYQGRDPGSFQRVPQEEVRHSLCAAGLGSAYICADFLRLPVSGAAGTASGASASDALRPVTKGSGSPTAPRTRDIDLTVLRHCLDDGDAWFAKNFRADVEEWPCYYLYALERYQSFRERVKAGDKREAEPDWYNAGVDYLRRTQLSNGSWYGDAGHPVDTGFAILFLLRSAQEMIAKAEGYGGRLRAGRGLPVLTGEVRVAADGRIVKSEFQQRAEALLAILEAEDTRQLAALPRDLVVPLSADPHKRQSELARLRRLVAASSFDVRLAAVRMLAQTRDLDNVPALIYALGDPDNRVVREARNALRVLSRKVDGFGLPDSPTPAEKLNAIEHWKQWYLTIRPHAQFLNPTPRPADSGTRS